MKNNPSTTLKAGSSTDSTSSLEARLGAGKLKILFFLIIIAAFLVRIFGVEKTGLTAGEEFWLSRGENIVSHLAKGDIKNSTKSFERHPGIPAALLIGLSMKYLSGPTEKESQYFPLPSFYSKFSLKLMTPISAARLPITILGALSCGLLFWFAARTMKNLSIAFFAGLFLAFDPFHIGLSRMAHQDIALSLFFAASLFFYFIGEKKRKNYLKIIGGIFFGLALLTKIVALLIPVIIVIWKLRNILKKDSQNFLAKKLPFNLVDFMFLIIGVLMFFIFYPSMWENPLGGFIRHLTLNLGKNTAYESYLFFGKNLKETNFLFYLVAIPIRMALISLIFFIIGIYLWIKRRMKHKILYSFLIVWLIIVVLIMSSAGKLKDRYISPIWPLLSFFAAYGLYFIIKKIVPRYRFWVGTAFIIIFTLPTVVYLYPNYLFFFNWPTNYFYGGFNIIDSNASICLKEAAMELNNLPDAKNKTAIASFGPGFEPYFIGKTIGWTSEYNSRNYPVGDFVVLNSHNMSRHSPQTLYRYFKDRKPLYSIKANGYECAWVYKNEIASRNEN